MLLVGSQEGYLAHKNVCFKAPWNGTRLAGYHWNYHMGVKSFSLSISCGDAQDKDDRRQMQAADPDLSWKWPLK